MAKQYVVTEAEFELLLNTMKLESMMGARSALAEFERVMTIYGVPPESAYKAAEALYPSIHRSFHYHVYGWIQNIKK